MMDKRIVDLYRLRPVGGEVGIEIEMEGSGLGAAHQWGEEKWRHEFPWDFKMDGSLRGESCEWVLNHPILRADVNSALGKLWDSKDKVAGKFNPSRRCGVHIHMNVQQLTEKQVWNLIGTYIAFENILMKWVGEDREGNLFCLRASDAHELIDRLTYAKEKNSLMAAISDQVRYAGVNITSLTKYGSLEFRALGTPPEPQKITQWIRMLWCIRDLSLQFNDLRDLLYQLSASDARDFVVKVFGPRTVLRHIEELDTLLREGMRNVQDMLVTRPSPLRNNPNLAGPGWHVFDPDKPGMDNRIAKLLAEFGANEDDAPDYEPGDPEEDD